MQFCREIWLDLEQLNRWARGALENSPGFKDLACPQRRKLAMGLLPIFSNPAPLSPDFFDSITSGGKVGAVDHG